FQTIPPETSADWKKKTTIFLSSQSLSMFGSMLVQYAIIWYVTLNTESGAMLTISTLAGFLPQIVLSLFAGVWADRYPRKLMIIGADALTAASTLVLAIFFLVGYQELWLIFLVSAIRSVGAGIQMPAVNALLPQIVPTDRLIKVNSINGTIQPVIMITTPLISGALLALSRLEAIFFIDVLTAILAISLVWVLKVPPLPQKTAAEKVGYLDDLKAGLAYIRGNRAVKTLFIFFAFVFFLVAPVAFLSPLLVARSFGEEVWRLTANEVTFFAGSILGGIVMTVWGGFQNRFRTIGLSCLIWAGLFAGLGLSRDFVPYLIFMFLAGVPMPFMNASTTTLLQEAVEPQMHGRIFGVHQLIISTVMPLGMLFFGPIADVVSIELLLVLTSIPMAIPAVWLFLKRQPVKIQPQGHADEYEMQPGD
ncbi:MAG TPA: MFS transporter, partial [Anaerolineaceae bacterium]|nr:MFS transporter [Anaerolineaceae bacterium]